MESFKHVSNTWLIAQLIHPFIFYAYGFASVSEWDWDALSYLPLLIIFDFVFSIIGYALCILSFDLVSRLRLSVNQKFCLWIIIMSLCIALGLLLTCLLFFNHYFFFAILFVLLSGISSAVLSALLRYRQFVSTVNFLNQESTTI